MIIVHFIWKSWYRKTTQSTSSFNSSSGLSTGINLVFIYSLGKTLQALKPSLLAAHPTFGEFGLVIPDMTYNGKQYVSILEPSNHSNPKPYPFQTKHAHFTCSPVLGWTLTQKAPTSLIRWNSLHSLCPGYFSDWIFFVEKPVFALATLLQYQNLQPCRSMKNRSKTHSLKTLPSFSRIK